MAPAHMASEKVLISLTQKVITTVIKLGIDVLCALSFNKKKIKGT